MRGSHKEEKLSVIYDKRMGDFVVRSPRKADGGLVLDHLLGDILRYSLTKWMETPTFPYETENFKQELERRGYDLSTLRFSIELKKPLEP